MFKFLFWGLFLLMCPYHIRGKDTSNKEMTDLLDGLFKDYDKRIRPSGKNGTPVRLEMSAYILDVFDINEEKHEFNVQLYLRHHWVDPRLSFTARSSDEKIMISPEHAEKMWTPDTFCVNMRESVQHYLTSKNEMTRLNPDGEVLKSNRLTIKASCKMNLGYFPFDRQLCTLEFESYAFSASEFYYVWRLGKDKSVGISGEVSSLKFQVGAINAKETQVALKTGNYSRISIEFFLIRQSANYFQNCYFPAFILTLLSFLTLWIGSLETRLHHSLLIMMTTLLFMILNSNGMPKVSYQTALDLYIFLCANLVANAVVVNYGLYKFTKFQKPRRNIKMGMRELRNRIENGAGNIDEMKENIISSAADLDDYPDDEFNEGTPKLSSRFQEMLYNSLARSKYSLPIFFLCFNIIYWLVVLIGSSWYPEDFLILENHGN